LVVAVLGSLVGLIVANVGIEALLALRPGNLPRVDDVGIDRTVLMFTMGVTVMASIIFGLFPAIRTSRARPALSGRGGSGGGRERASLRSGLIVAEVALSVVLVVAAGLLVRSFLILQQVDPGFDSENVVAVNVSLPFFQYRDAARRRAFHTLLGDAVADIPGVESAGAIAVLPLSGEGGAWISPFALSEGDEAEWEANRADYRPVMPGYFDAMKTTTLLGRTFDRASNEPDAAPVIVVDDVFAQAVWGGEDPVGRRVYVVVPSDNQLSERVGAEVIGVVEHVRHTDLTRDGIGTIYMPYRLNPWFESSLVLRTTGDAAGTGNAVREALAEIDPSVPAFDVRLMDDYVADALAPTRFAMILLGFFALVALALAAVGLYGIISTAVQQRRREIGVRIAMGAERKGILRLVVGQGLGLTLVGVGLGLAVAALASRAVSALLFGVAPTDPITFVVASIGLGIVAVLACYVPASRASRVDPVVALRAE
jgi:putative ABC transport system permease protein